MSKQRAIALLHLCSPASLTYHVLDMAINKQGEEVRALLETERNGMLCTLSKKFAGWPFGSIAPYAMTAAGEPLLFISDIAEHTRNLRTDARASLLIQDTSALDDPQAGARVTIMGYALPVTRPYLEDAGGRYLSRFPNSASYFEAHDFSLYRIKVTQIRYIGGFGEIYWLGAGDVIDIGADSTFDIIAPHIEMICSHMNEDHPDALIAYAAAFAETRADSAEMIHVDSYGFDMIAVHDSGHKHIRIDFPSPVTTTDEVRAAMVDLVRRARQVI
ncbi:MAG: DUF2470 domain-containing protein [Blastocatellia bacterium]|nr:DUF2470 domain-containing protein [Blastocatellia bacterium]